MSSIAPAMLLRWLGLHATLAGEVLCPLGACGFPARPLPVLLFSQVAWDDVWQRPQELARGLAASRPVVFCSPVQLHQVAGPLSGRWRRSRVEQGGRLRIECPLILSGEYRTAPVRAINRAIVHRALAGVVPKGGFLFLTNCPWSDTLAAQLSPAATGYDIIDDFCAFNWAPRDARAREDRLVAQCRFGFAGTHSLLEQFGSRIAGMEYLASGVDFAKISAPAPEPAELRGVPRPRLLYVGTLNDRLSGELIAETANRFPAASVVLVGPRRATFEAPAFPSNVLELGLKPHDALPGFYQHCDLGIMPFADNAAARAINPVKTLEFLAAGSPVVSTPIPDVERFYRGVVDVAAPGDWPAAIERLLAAGRGAGAAARIEFARERSWRKLVERVEAKLRAVEGECAP